MTLRRDMLAAAAKASPLLGPRAVRVVGFLKEQLRPEGGFGGRGPDADLYYTVFGLESLMALDADIPAAATDAYLRRFIPSPGTGQTHPAGLDLVHLACLGRCWVDLAERGGRSIDSGLSKVLLDGLAAHRSPDGGYALAQGATEGSAYACLLALGLLQDLASAQSDEQGLIRCIQSLQMPDGGFANAMSMQVGATPATAAAVTSLHYLGRPVPEGSVEFLLSQAAPSGGFAAFPWEGGTGQALVQPDLLSTATALHALSVTGQQLDEDLRGRCLGFVQGLWSEQGGFRGTVADPVVDCEYTYYGLMSLGHLGSCP
jgi:prenyltransferase beta subunit